ncbi:MAG: rod shape determining protein RodA, partial [Candidatus Azotimanducaceae bacterium]
MSQDFVRSLRQADYSFGRSPQSKSFFHLDLQLLLILMAIVSYGLIVLYSAVEQQSAPLISQSIKIAIAFVVMGVMAQISPIFYLRLAPWLYIVGLILLVVVLFYGYSVNGSQRWLRIPGLFTFQPSELMKLVVPMILAWYFHDRHLPPKPKHLFWAGVM